MMTVPRGYQNQYAEPLARLEHWSCARAAQRGREGTLHVTRPQPEPRGRPGIDRHIDVLPA